MPIVGLPSTNTGVKNINTPKVDGTTNLRISWSENLLVIY
jgi:hypothetical protein